MDENKDYTGISGCVPEERGSVLDDAKKAINGARQNIYGQPEDSFNLIGEYWTSYIVKKINDLIKDQEPVTFLVIDSHDVALLMALFKIAREQHQGKRDNLVDAAGYIGLAGDKYKN